MYVEEKKEEEKKNAVFLFFAKASCNTAVSFFFFYFPHLSSHSLRAEGQKNKKNKFGRGGRCQFTHLLDTPRHTTTTIAKSVHVFFSFLSLSFFFFLDRVAEAPRRKKKRRRRRRGEKNKKDVSETQHTTERVRNRKKRGEKKKKGKVQKTRK